MAVAGMFHRGGSVCERSKPATRGRFGRAKRGRYARRRRRFLGFTARKTSRCNLAIEISFLPSSQSTFNFSVLRGSQVDFLLFNLLRSGPRAARLAGEPDFF